MAAIAHIGYGHWGKNIARNLAELGCLAAVVDTNHKAAENAANSLGARVSTVANVLADPGINAVSIATPAANHFEHAWAALAAGKHVFVEKPLALDIEGAKQLCELANAKGLVLMVGHLLRYHPGFVRLCELVTEEKLGRLLHIRSNRLSLGKIRTEENVLWSFAPHDVSMILALANDEPERIVARGCAINSRGVADIADIQMQFASGLEADVSVSWMHPFKEQRLVVVGTEAMAVFEDSQTEWSSKLKVYDHRIDRNGQVPLPVKGEVCEIALERAEPLKAECRHFTECVDIGATPLTDGREGLRVLKVLQAADKELTRFGARWHTDDGKGR